MGKGKNEIKPNGKYPKIMYGLKGISQLFNVSLGTAVKLSNTVIKDACKKNGRIILVDTRKALELFGFSNPDDFVE